MLIPGAIALLLASSPVGGVSNLDISPLDAAVLSQMNRVRTRPKTYVPLLSEYESKFVGAVVYETRSEVGTQTEEGPPAVQEAVRDLSTRHGEAQLSWDGNLAASAAELAEDQRRSGNIGHATSDGAPFEKRIARHMEGEGEASEVIAYGETTEEAVIRALIVDDGVPQRSHRRSLFGANYRKAGIACRPHPVYGMSCVIDLSS